MKLKIKSRIAGVLLLVLSLLALQTLSLASPEDGLAAPIGETAETQQGSAGFSEIASKDGYSLFADKMNGEFYVEHTASKKTWRSNPADRDADSSVVGINKFSMFSQLIMVIYDQNLESKRTVVSHTGSVMWDGGLTVKNIENGLRLNYSFPADEQADGKSPEPIVIPMDITLGQGGKLTAEVNIEEIKDFADRRVIEISLVPFFGSGGTSDEGYILLPDGSGALANFNNGKIHAEEYAQNIYGIDASKITDFSSSITQTARLPVFGIQKENTGLLAVINEGDTAAAVRAYTSGHSNNQNTAYASFEIYAMDMVPIGGSGSGFVNEFLKYDFERPKIKKASVNYYFLPDNASGYTGMAKKYREILKQSGAEDNKSSPEMFVELFGGYAKRSSFLGIPYTQNQAVTSFEDALKITKELKALGVDTLSLAMSNWSQDEFSGKIQSKVKAAGALGGNKALKNLSSELKKLNSQLYLLFAPTSAAKNGNGYNTKFDSAKKLSGERIALYNYKPNLYVHDSKEPILYMQRLKGVLKTIESFTAAINKTDPNLQIYNKDLSEYLYTDFSKGDTFLSRQEMKNELLKYLSAKENKWMFEHANAYQLSFTKTVLNAPIESSGFQITDESVPFYQLAVSGLVNYTMPPANMTEMSQRTYLLKALETGSNIYFRWSANAGKLSGSRFDELYNSDYRKWKSDGVEMFETLKTVFEKTGSMNLTAHKKVQNSVFESTFEGGKRIVVNYSNSEVTFEGVSIAPKMYHVF